MDDLFAAKTWRNINWGEISSKVHRIQTLIFEAFKIGNISRVHELQNSIIHMYDAKLLAIRRVTQDNMGKRTPGVDGISKLNSKE